MIVNVYAIFDQKARCYGMPFFAINANVAGRMFGALADDAASVVGKHPSDFTLFGLGSFDDALGTFENYQSPQSLGLAAQFKEQV